MVGTTNDWLIWYNALPNLPNGYSIHFLILFYQPTVLEHMKLAINWTGGKPYSSEDVHAIVFGWDMYKPPEEIWMTGDAFLRKLVPKVC